MIKDLIDKVLSHNEIVIFSHIRPDGDAIGSQTGLARWLTKRGKTVHAFNDDAIPPNINWLCEGHEITKPDKHILEKCDAIILVDGNHPDRFGGYADILRNTEKPLYMIDHHPDPEPGFEAFYSDPTASSTAEMIYVIIREAGDLDRIDEQVALSLYTGIVTDTGSFRFDSVTPVVHEITADLLRRGGFSPATVYQRVFDTYELKNLKLMGKALEGVQLHHDGELATIAITEKMLEETGTSYDDLDGMITFALGLQSVQAAVLMYERDGRVKLSLRSKTEKYDVNKAAREFGGGGHKKAAGAWHNGPLEAAVMETMQVMAGLSEK